MILEEDNNEVIRDIQPQPMAGDNETLGFHNISYEEAGKDILEALENSTTPIKKLTLINCHIDDVLLRTILQNPKLNNLEVLDLSRNNITNNGCYLISNYLQSNGNLKELNLSNNYIIGEKGMHSILQECKQRFNLQKISLPFNERRGSDRRLKLLSMRVLQQNPNISTFADALHLTGHISFNVSLSKILESLKEKTDFMKEQEEILALFMERPLVVEKWFEINMKKPGVKGLLSKMLSRISKDCELEKSNNIRDAKQKISSFLFDKTYDRKKNILTVLNKQYLKNHYTLSQASKEAIDYYISYYAFEGKKNYVFITAIISICALTSISGFAFNICTYQGFSASVLNIAYQEIFPNFYVYDFIQIISTAGIWIAGGLMLYKTSNEECKRSHTFLGMAVGVGMYGVYYFVDFLLSRVNEYILDHYLMFSGGGALAGIFFGALSLLLRGYSMIDPQYGRNIRGTGSSLLWSLVENREITILDVVSTFALYIAGGISIAVVLPYLSQTYLAPLIYNADLLQLTNFSIAGAIGIATTIITSIIGYHTHITHD